MNKAQRKTLEAVFESPTRADIRWADVESMFRALGAQVTEGSGSRVRVGLEGCRAVFHRPHPGPTMKKGAVNAVRGFLMSVEIAP